MSSILEVPAQLALVLTLAASGPGDGAPAAPPAEIAAIASAPALPDPSPLEGPYRFSESNWLRALRDDLPVSEADADYSARIFKTSGRRYYVPVAAERERILGARSNAALAARAAQAFAADNAVRMRGALHRPLTAGDLYLAHVFGPEAAISFIQLAAARPGDPAAKQMPALAQSAPELLPTSGAAVTLAQLYKRLTDPMRKFARSSAAAALDLKPTIEEASQVNPALLHAESLAWHAKVNTSGGATLPQ